MVLPEAYRQYIHSLCKDQASFDAFCHISEKTLRPSIRVNTLKITVAEFKTHAKQLQWKLTAIPWCQTGFWIERPLAQISSYQLGNTVEHLMGLFYIQEASSMLPVSALYLTDTYFEKILDIAAAPGSKTTQIAAHQKNQGLIVANESSASRLKALAANIQRCGIANVALSHCDGRKFGYIAANSFDAILLDAPCTGEGTVRKNPSVLKNWSLKKARLLASLQSQLIKSAFKALNPGGVLIYSTCTLNTYENQQVCLSLKHSFPTQVEFQVLNKLFPGAKQCITDEGFLQVWPHVYDSGGFFVARIYKRAGRIPAKKAQVKLTRKLASESKKAILKLKNYLQEQFGLSEAIPWDRIKLHNNDYCLLPDGMTEISHTLRLQGLGTKLAKYYSHDGIRCYFALGQLFGRFFKKNTVCLSCDQVQQYYRGHDINWNHTSKKGQVLVTYDKHPVGFGKWLPGRIKNTIPRHLIRNNIKF